MASARDDEEEDIVYVERMPARRFAMVSGGLGGALTLTGVGYAVLGAMSDATSFVAAGLFAAVGIGTGAFGLLHAVQRNYVTRDVLKVELGLGEVVIPLESISEVRLEQDTTGLRRRIYAERAQKVALVPGGKPLVRVAWQQGDEARVFYAGSAYPDQLKAAILAAAQHKRRAPASVRVATHAAVHAVREHERSPPAARQRRRAKR